jgi:hypothetical protein
MGKSMRNIITYFILFVFGISFNLIPQQFDWAKCLSGINVKTTDITKDSHVNNYVIGGFESNITLDSFILIPACLFKEKGKKTK